MHLYESIKNLTEVLKNERFMIRLMHEPIRTMGLKHVNTLQTVLY